jgi:hypothetical protein
MQVEQYRRNRWRKILSMIMRSGRRRRRRRYGAEFSESEHPRDDGGQFTSGGEGGKRQFEGSDQDKSFREWEDNWSAVMDAPDTASDKDLRRAMNYGDHLRRSAVEKGHKELAEGLSSEIDNIKRILRQRESAPSARILDTIAKGKAAKGDLAKGDAARAAAEKKVKAGDWKTPVPQAPSSPGQKGLLDSPEPPKTPAPSPPKPAPKQSSLFGSDEDDDEPPVPEFSQAADKRRAAKKDKSGIGSPQGTLFETRKQSTLFSLAGFMQAEFYSRGWAQISENQ